jgi:hypothetical protein
MPAVGLLSATGYPSHQKVFKTIDQGKYLTAANTYHPSRPTIDIICEVSDHHTAKRILKSKASGRSRTSSDWATSQVSRQTVKSVCKTVDNSNICNACEEPDNRRHGHLVCCDGCLRSFHKSCIGLRVVPRGWWECGNCHIRISKRQKQLSKDRITIDCQDY